MSAARNSSDTQSAFIYTNFYEHYQHLANSKGIVLKSKPEVVATSQVCVVSEQQKQDLANWVHAGKKDMAKNLSNLRDASKRFKFLFAELDDLLKRE